MLEASRAIAVAYGLVSVAALIRIFGRYMAPAHAVLVEVAAAAWIAAFGIYLWVYGPMRCAPRTDG